MKTYIISYVTSTGLLSLNNVIVSESRSTAIDEVVESEDIKIILSVVSL